MRSSPDTQPAGVVILVTLGAIFGIFAFMAGLSVFGFGAFVTTSAGFLGVFFSILGFLVLVTGVLQIVVAYGAWLLREWSWRLGFLVGIAGIAINVLWLAAGASLGLGLVAILAALASLYCLDGSSVRTALGRPSPSRLGALGRRPTESTARKDRGHLIRRPIGPSEDN
jgi:hypothetical protein